jgi:hypothetical protein
VDWWPTRVAHATSCTAVLAMPSLGVVVGELRPSCTSPIVHKLDYLFSCEDFVVPLYVFSLTIYEDILSFANLK